MINPGVIIIWTGTHAGIPTGYVRETSLDDKIPKGLGAEVINTAGGNLTHTHNSPTHSHSMASHAHNVSTGFHIDASFVTSGDSATSAVASHQHTLASVAGVVSSGSSAGLTTGSASNLPPYYEVIFIRATLNTSIPDTASVLWSSASVTPGGFANHASLANKYLKGAPTATNAGGTGGSTSHSHSTDHSHTFSHTHSDNLIGGFTGDRDLGVGDGPSKSAFNHAHSITLDSQGETINYTGTVSGTSIEPAYKKLRALQNTSGANKQVVPGMIALWLGSLTAVPAGWKLCNGANGTPDMTDKFLKITNADGEVSDTGGSNTHNHSNVSHSHTASSTHTHSSGGTVGYNSITGGTASSVSSALAVHRHTVTSVGTATSVLSATDMTFDSSNAEPPYRTVGFIQFKFEIGGIALHAML